MKKTKCRYHFWPSCHPAQVGPDDVYACAHIGWPVNLHRYDFEPIVNCGGNPVGCEIPRWMMTTEEELEIGLDKYPESKRAKQVDKVWDSVSMLQGV